MALIFESIRTEGIASVSYLVGDDGTGQAAIIDPTADVEKFVELAKEKKLVVTHIFETHIHADLVSGARELAERVESARIYVSVEDSTEYGFKHEGIRWGMEFKFGETTLTVRHTPGHTPEHVSFELTDAENPGQPWGVLTGDSLFVGSAGRPDLLGSDETEKLTRQLFETLRGYYLSLPDSVMLFPAHGHGSPCGADIAARLQSTIGFERETNPFLQFEKFEDFKEFASSGAPPVPTYYPRMKKVNRAGPEVFGNLPKVRGLTPEEFRTASGKDVTVLDTRDLFAFSGGHIAGAWNIGASPMMSIWAGWLLEPETPILLVTDSDAGVDGVVSHLLRTGYTNFAGYLSGGMDAWVQEGEKIERSETMGVHEVRRAIDAGESLQVVDVRTPSEWEEGIIPGAKKIFLPELREKLGELDPALPTITYCASGYRASIGTGILLQEGFANAGVIPGSWKAWKAAGFPIEKTGS